MFEGKILLVTGGTGSWARELVQQLLANHNPAQVRIYSRGEAAQVNMRRAFNDDPRLQFIIGDVRDLERLSTASRGVHTIFHLAALKHVPVCEENPVEAVRTNILGTQYVIDAAIANGVKKVVDVSSDKAASPLNLYGTTKSVGEKLVISANALVEETAFICIRAGNVLGTAGSVVPLFRNQLLNLGNLTLTDDRMTRFFLNLSQAIELVFGACKQAVGGEIFVINMPAAKITDLAEVMSESLVGGKAKVRTIGKRPGEKIHEVLVSKDEQERTFVRDGYYVILPMIHLKRIRETYDTQAMEAVPFPEFTSENARRLDKVELKAMLEKEGWLSKAPLPSDALSMDKECLKNPFSREGWVEEG